MSERRIQNTDVAVVGGAGFLGSHLVDHLIQDRNCRVLVIDNLISGHRKFVNKLATFEHADITGSEDYLLKLFRHHEIKYVFNYAAEPYIPVSFARPIHVFNINAFGALKVINAAQEAGCEGILQVSSAEIYGEDGELQRSAGSLNEWSMVMPHSTYGASKAAIDAIVQVRWREAKTPVIALRQFNCVGERETHKYVVPEIVSQLANVKEGDYEIRHRDIVCNRFVCAPDMALHHYQKDNPIVRLGNNSFRDFQYAGDAVRMATELLEKGQFGEVYNMGSEDGIKIYDLAKLIGKLIGFSDVRIEVDESRKRPWEIWHLQSDNRKLYSVIESRPTVTLEQALRRTIEYFVGNGGWDF